MSLVASPVTMKSGRRQAPTLRMAFVQRRARACLVPPDGSGTAIFVGGDAKAPAGLRAGDVDGLNSTQVGRARINTKNEARWIQ